MFGNLYGQLMGQANQLQQPMPKPNQIPTKPGYTQPAIGANPMATIAGNIQQQPPQGYTQPVQPFATNGFMSGFFQQPQQQMVNQPQGFMGNIYQNPQQQNPMQGHPWFNMGQMGHLFNRYRGF